MIAKNTQNERSRAKGENGLCNFDFYDKCSHNFVTVRMNTGLRHDAYLRDESDRMSLTVPVVHVINQSIFVRLDKPKLGVLSQTRSFSIIELAMRALL